MLSPKNIARIENSQFLQSNRLGYVIVLNMCFIGGDFQDIVIIVFQLKSSLSYVSKNTIRDGGLALRYTLFTQFILFILLKLFITVCTVYDIQLALHCLESSRYAYIYIVRDG